ncbi:MAG: hypothetical protein AAF215_05405 [Cyanobacteria bacterium P01_A01_bin.123]
MTAATTIDRPIDLIEQARSLSIDDVWAALPERVRANDAIMNRIQSADPKLAAVSFSDYLWEDDPNDTGRRRRSLPPEKLIPLALCLYLHQGGKDPEDELRFWKKLEQIA